MIYSAQIYAGVSEGMLGTKETMGKLRLKTALTLYKWIQQGKIKAHTVKVGSRTYYEFDESEVERVAKLRVDRAKKGKPLLKPE